MKKDPFKEYLKEAEPHKREKGYVWHTAIGLQAVDTDSECVIMKTNDLRLQIGKRSR